MTAYTVEYTVDVDDAETPEQAARKSLALLTEAIENVDPMKVLVHDLDKQTVTEVLL